MNIVKNLKTIIQERPRSLFQKPLRVLRAIKRNPIKQNLIRKRQRAILRSKYLFSAPQLIVFIVPSDDMVNGGILSICAHYNETLKIKQIHGAEAVMSTGPDEKLLLKYTRFKNNNYIFDFSEVLSFFKKLNSIMIHIPEYMVDDFIKKITIWNYPNLCKIKYVHFNIMLQNIKGLKYMRSLKSLERFGKITCTTAHRKYTTSELRKELGIPLHMLSVKGGPEFYNKKNFFEKTDLMIVSPDEHPLKEKILSLINEKLPKIKTQIISNLTYEQYKITIEKAKWALTFGEGLDGYFIETIFSGGVSFSVYNSEFFTEDFKSLHTVYDSYNILVEKICSDIIILDEISAYKKYQDQEFEICCKYYNYQSYLKNLELFYKGNYTYK